MSYCFVANWQVISVALLFDTRSHSSVQFTRTHGHTHTGTRARHSMWWLVNACVCMGKCVHTFYFLRVYAWAYVDSSNSRSSLMTTQQLIIIYLSSGGLLSLFTSLFLPFSFTHSLTHIQYLHNWLTETCMKIENATQMFNKCGRISSENCQTRSHCKRGAYTWISGKSHTIALHRFGIQH